MPTAQAVSTPVISLEDYRKQHKPNQSPRKTKTPVERFREDKQKIIEAIALAADPPSQDSRKERIRELLEEVTPSPGIGIGDTQESGTLKIECPQLHLKIGLGVQECKSKKICQPSMKQLLILVNWPSRCGPTAWIMKGCNVSW